MAVSVVSNPPVSPFILSPSYSTKIVVSSTVYGTANITQFRFVAEVSALSALGTKYTVPSDPSNDNGSFDVRELFKLVLKLGPYAYGSTNDITKEPWPIAQNEFVTSSFQVIIKEQYYNAGVFTTNTGPTLTFVGSRGYTDQANNEWIYSNYFQIPQLAGLTNLLAYSGHSRIMYAQRTDGASWQTTGVAPWMNIKMTYKNQAGGTKIATNYWFNRTLAGYQKVVYIPLYKSGTTDDDDFGSVVVEMNTSPVNLGTQTLEETVTISKTIESCGTEKVIMFKDRFHQWSFMSFTKYNYTTINTGSQSAEIAAGRFRYNVKAADTLILNTDWLPDPANVVMSDLIASDKMYLVDTDGSLEEVRIVDNSLRLKTHDVDGLHQYQLSFTKSLDNFTP